MHPGLRLLERFLVQAGRQVQDLPAQLGRRDRVPHRFGLRARRLDGLHRWQVRSEPVSDVQDHLRLQRRRLQGLYQRHVLEQHDEPWHGHDLQGDHRLRRRPDLSHGQVRASGLHDRWLHGALDL